MIKDYKNYGKQSALKEILMILSVFVIGIVVGTSIGDFKASITIKTKDKGVQLDCRDCHRLVAMTRYFQKNGNPTPEEMALAVLKTKNPKLLAAISVKGEKNTPYWARNTGYKNRHSGAWQMSKSHKKSYGVVPYDAIGQALQAEKYLTDISKDLSIKEVLSEYGGDSTDKYANRVLAELVKVP